MPLSPPPLLFFFLAVLFAIFTSYGDAHGQDLGMYSSFADVSVMIFIGFGYAGSGEADTGTLAR